MVKADETKQTRCKRTHPENQGCGSGSGFSDRSDPDLTKVPRFGSTTLVLIIIVELLNGKSL